MSRDPTISDESGFTLLEILVALSILSLSLAVVLGTFSGSLHRVQESETQAFAGAYARSLLAAVGTTQPLADGGTSGVLPSGMRWHLLVSPYGDATDAEAWIARVRQVTATVTWQAGDTERSVRLSTLRLVPREPPP